MKKQIFKKFRFNIRNKLWWLSGFALVLIVSLVLSGILDSSSEVYAANTEGGNPLYKVSLEDYLKQPNSSYPWDDYSNENSVSRAKRLPMFHDYYNSQINSDVASSYGWPTNISYETGLVNVSHNDTIADSGYDLYLLEFSTSNKITIDNIDIQYSVYFIEQDDGTPTMKYTDAVELSKDSCDFLGRSDRDKEFCQGEVEMTTIQLPKDSIPVGIFVWQDGDFDDYAWELSYLNMYKIDSISDVIKSGSSVANNYRTYEGTRVGYIDNVSIEEKYMARRDGENKITDDQYFEWLYPLTPTEENMEGYILEVVTQGPNVASPADRGRTAIITLEYSLLSGIQGLSKKIEISSDSLYVSHPFVSPEDFDSWYAFEYGNDYVNPIAQNSNNKKVHPLENDPTSFPDNNKIYLEDYDMQDQEFWTLPGNQNYNFTKMNEFAGMMLGNYFDAATMAESYLKEYRALQIPITLPIGLGEITKISSTAYNPYKNNASITEKYGDPNKNAGIQSIRLIKLSEPLADNATTTLTSNGFLSSESVLRMKGTVIAETQGKISSYQGTWTPNNPTTKLITYAPEKQIKVDTITSEFQGVTVTFSDTFGAGLDNLLADVITKFPDINSYDFPTNQAMVYVLDYEEIPLYYGLPIYNLLGGYYRDPLTLTVAYYDDFDEIREVDIPFVTAYLMQLIMDARRIGEVDPETWISGIFQQGQTVGLRLNLSEFKSLISVKLSYGYGDSNPLTGKLRSMEGDAFYDDDNDKRLPMTYDLSSDAIAIDNICFYDSVTASNFVAKYNGKGLTSTISTSLTPSSSWQASTEDGQIITKDHSFTAYKVSREGNIENMIDGAPIKDRYKDKYLVEITTLDTALAGTISNLTYQLHYTDTYGTSHTTPVSSLQGAAKDFYGNSSRNLSTFATDFQNKAQTAMHLTSGSKFCFVTEINNLEKFDGITLSSDGTDEWQPEQVRILKLTSLSERSATRDTVYLGNLTALDIPNNMKDAVAKNLGVPTYRWDRTYTGTVLASATPNILLHSGKTSVRINFTVHNADGTTIAPDKEIEEIKYLEKIPTTMTYEDTLVDLGLNIVKNTYQVHVDVANVDDAGSGNYFYFQLLFENGRSGLVLANQQLPSDSFRQGLTETFEIQTTQRYGELKAVRIICEATASTASTFDKLNIDKITVTLNSQQGTGKSWIVDRVGWIDINYVDEVQQSYASDDTIILENSDLTLDFPVTSISSSTELMFCITTGKQESSSSATLNMTSLGDNIEGVITYTDFQNTTKTVNIDLAQKIMDFNENESTSRILRSGTMDRFVISLSDVKQIDSLILTRNEGKNADWLISDISIQKVGGVGDVYLSAYTGEYIRNIAHSEYLTRSTSQNVALGLNDSKTFHFEAHTIEADISSEDNNAWNTTITRYPISSDESLNIYVYLINASGEPYNLSAGDNVDASIVYSSSMGTGALKASFKNIRAQSATKTSSVLFAQGLPIQSVGSLKSLDLRGNFSGTLKPIVRCVYIEHVQGNVIKDTLYVPFNNASLALDKVSANISSLEALTPMKQIVRLQPKENTSALLTPESSDIAVALRYTSSLDPETTKMVYQSPYVFLTDVDYTVLDNREHIEVPFQLNGVGEIVGLTVISSGPAVEFENALITNYPRPTATDDKENELTTLLGSCSIAESFVSTNIISKMMKTSKDVTPVTFTFTTPKEELVAGCGTSGQVGMLITYTDSSNKEQTYRITNILDYLPLDNPPFPDTVTSFNILMTDVAYLNSVTLTPATDDWFLSEVNAKVTTYDNIKQTTVNKTAVVNQWAKADGPLTIDMRPDSVNTDGPVINKITGFSISAAAQQSKVTASASSGNPLSIKVIAGDTISFTPTFQKVGTPTANINWTAYKYEQFFTDYNDGSATFTVPTEEAILADNLPRQYTLSAVCSENNSLAIPITIDVVSQEDLDNAKEGTAKLTLVTLQGNKTISTATYNESEDITLKVPSNAASDTVYKFVASLDKTTALLNVNDNKGLITPGNDGAYTLTVPTDVQDSDPNAPKHVSDYYLMFNVADAETETTYTITVDVALTKVEVETESESTAKMTVTLNGNETVRKNFSENSTNTLTYSNGTAGEALSYSFEGPADTQYTVKAVESTYADEMVDWTNKTTNAASGTLFTVPTLEALNAKLTTPLAYGDTASFNFEVTVKIPAVRDSEGNITTSEKTITGTLCINVVYTDPASGATTEGSTTEGSNTGGSSTEGSTTGGSSTEGSTTGGSSTEGSTTGGSSTEGSTTGGSSTEGSNTGGSSTTGGSSNSEGTTTVDTQPSTQTGTQTDTPATSTTAETQTDTSATSTTTVTPTDTSATSTTTVTPAGGSNGEGTQTTSTRIEDIIPPIGA